MTLFSKIVGHVNFLGFRVTNKAQLWASVQQAFDSICTDDTYITILFDNITETLKTVALNNGNL